MVLPKEGYNSGIRRVVVGNIDTDGNWVPSAANAIISVGTDGEYATIADAIASLSDGTPIDRSVGGTTASSVLDSTYTTINGLSDLRDTEFTIPDRWITVQDAGSSNTRHLTGLQLTGAETIVTTIAAQQVTAGTRPYLFEELPVVVLELEASTTHVISTDVQLPETTIIVMRPPPGTHAYIRINDGGKLRAMDDGGWIVKDTDLICTDPDALNITNKSGSTNAAYALFVEWDNVILKQVQSSPGGIVTAQLTKLISARFKWYGQISAVQPNPSTVILHRFTSGIFDVDIQGHSEQIANNRFLTLEFSTYKNTHDQPNTRSIQFRGHAISWDIHLAARELPGDAFAAAPLDGNAWGVLILGTARATMHALSNVIILGNRLAGGMADGSVDCQALTAILEEAPAGTTSVTNITMVGSDGGDICGVPTFVITPQMELYRIILVGSNISLTGAPQIDLSAIPNGKLFTIWITDAGGGGSTLTLKDESVVPGSGIITFSGLGVPGNLVITDDQIALFQKINDKAIQLSPPRTFQTAPS